MPMSRPSSSGAGVWRRAATHSGLWLALAPLRRAWLRGERCVTFPTIAAETLGADERVEEVVRGSWLFRTADRTLNDVTRAWRHSAIVARSRRLADGFTSLAPAERVRAFSVLALSASATALAFELLLRPEPLAWLVPAAVALGALVVFAGARALASAFERQR
jgi:hypothetical protein